VFDNKVLTNLRRLTRSMLALLFVGLLVNTGVTVVAFHNLADSSATAMENLRVMNEVVDNTRLAQINFKAQMELARQVPLSESREQAAPIIQRFELVEQEVVSSIMQARALALEQSRLLATIGFSGLAVTYATDAGAFQAIIDDHYQLGLAYRQALSRLDFGAVESARRIDGDLARQDVLVQEKLNGTVSKLLETSTRIRDAMQDRINQRRLIIFAVLAISGVVTLAVAVVVAVILSRTQNRLRLLVDVLRDEVTAGLGDLEVDDPGAPADAGDALSRPRQSDAA